MTRGPLSRLAITLLVLGVAARVHNAWSSPVLAGYDAFGHFTYIWFVATTGSLPLPTQGWSFFHPPLYYAAMAALWNALPAVDPALRLNAGKTIVALLGCVHALVVWRVLGRRFADQPHVRAAAALLNLLLPVQIYTVGFLGNEPLNAVISSVAILVALSVVHRPGASRAALLGLLLGLAMLTKTSSAAVVAGCIGAVVVCAARRRDFTGGARDAAVAIAVLLVVCGPWYARNVVLYGSPFQLSRTTSMVAYVEDNQAQAARGWADYLTFDPMIFRRPVWPRDSQPLDDPSPHGFERSVRESVWTGLYASAWFDALGGWVLPPVVESEAARRAGQLLLVLGLVPTGLLVFGFWSALVRTLRGERDDTVTTMLLLTVAMLGLLLMHTRNVPIPAAVKPSYLAPVSVAFAFWFAEGLAMLGRRRPRWMRPALLWCAAAGAASLAVFWQGFLFDAHAIHRTLPWLAEAETTQLGVVEYAGGRPDAAKVQFERAAETNYHLAWENLAFLAIDGGHWMKGVRLLRFAAHLQREQSPAGSAGREKFMSLAEAEYDHSIAVALAGARRRDKAVKLWHRALEHDPRHAEALWCVTVLLLEDRLAGAENDEERREAFEDADRALLNVRTLDPGLEAGWKLAAMVKAAAGNCDGARRTLDEWRAHPFWIPRNFPAETGTGAGFSASIGRRRLIEPHLPQASEALGKCGLVLEPS